MSASLQRRLWFAAAVPLIALVVAGLLLLQLAFEDTVERAFDARLGRTLVSLVGGLETTPEGRPRIRRALGQAGFDTIQSGWHWQVASSGEVQLRSRSLWDRDLPLLAARADGRASHRDLDLGGHALRAAVRRIELPGMAAPITVILTGPRSEIEAEVADFVRLSWLGAGGLVVLALAAIGLQLWLGLAPLRRFSSQVAELAAGQRDALDRLPVREFDAVVDELNQVIDQNRRLADSGRKLAGDLAHAIKTPLALLRARAAPDDSDQRAALARIEEVVDRHLARASADARRRRARADAGIELARLAALLGQLHPGKVLRIPALTGMRPVACESSDLQEMLGNLIDNALRAARRDVDVHIETIEATIVITIDDDGRGLADEALARLGERGRRFDESQPGTGLGVSISRDIAESYGGRLEFERSPIGGLRAALSLLCAP